VRVTFLVNPNPVLTKVVLDANPGTGVTSVLPAKDIDDIFRDQYGRILNLRDLQDGVKKLVKEYQDKGYVLANLIGSPKVSDDGVVTLQLAEGVVESISVRFQKKESKKETIKDEQEIKGRTQDYIIKRELQLKPGQVFNRNMVQKDLKRLFGLGIFEDVNISLNPGSDPSKVNVVVNVVERSSGSISLGGGVSSASGLFGTVSYQQQNIAGRNQKFSAETQVGERDLLFDLRFTDPWIDGDIHRTSYTVDIFRRTTIPVFYEGKNTNINTFNLPTDTTGDVPRVQRVGGGTIFTRPLSSDPYTPAEWVASAGFQYQRVSSRDGNDNIREFGTVYVNNLPTKLIPLTYSGSGQDDLFIFQTSIQRDRRNNPLQPTTGSYLRFGADQTFPFGLGSILFTRLRGNYSQYFPVKLTKFSKKPQTLAFNIQVGTLIGDLPPYEAFSLGGSNSVRGYNEGELGSGRSYAQASVEYRFPVFSVISGALFFDYGTDLGTNTEAAQLLSESGHGYGYGLGVRIQSPLGPIRIDYGINDTGGSRVNFGIGERF
jgi:outer membrane protein insertion porin family